MSSASSVADAITRVKIVRRALEGVDEDNKLAQAEAHASVMEFLEAVAEEYQASSTRCGQLIFALALNSMTWAVALPPLVLFPRIGDAAFNTFANSVELLLDVLDEEAGDE